MNELNFSEISKLSEKYSKDPQSRIFVQLADVYRKNNMIDEALDVLNKGLGYHPQYALAYLVLGKCYFEKRAHIQARDAFEKTIALDPQNVVALRMLARTYEMLKDEKGQINAYKNIIAIDPLDTNAKEKLSMLEALQRKEPLYTVAMAEEYEKQGNIEESLKIYENLLFTDSGDSILKEKVAELKKAIEEKRRKKEEEKIKDLQVEPVFKPEDLVKEAPEQVKTPQLSPRKDSEPAPTAEEGIQSLEDFLVEELEQAAEKVATQRGEEELAKETLPAPKEGASTEEIVEPLPRQEADIIGLSPDSEDAPAKTTPAHEISFGEIALEEKPTEEIEAAGIEKERQPSAESKEPAHTAPLPQPEVAEPVISETPNGPVMSEPAASGSKDEKEETEQGKKPNEEDFKSFQEWLSGLLK